MSFFCLLQSQQPCAAVGAIPAESILATIGMIANFSRPSQLKSYSDLALTVAQSGKTSDRVQLSPRGTRLMKRTMHLIVWKAVQTKDCE